jgi:signal transduction histidine kinase/predicted metal-dependent HD superfamily phosphohydrolase
MDLEQLKASTQPFIDKALSDPLIASVLGALKAGLSTNLTYHCVGHTEDVVRETVLFAAAGQLPEREIMLLATAAAFHDSGFLFQREDHESRGAEYAVKAMTESGKYSNAEIEKVRDYILDTKLVHSQRGRIQMATTPLAGYLLDADLSNFGRDDFLEKSELQRLEWNAEREQFLIDTLAFVSGHEWITPVARVLRQEKKEQNIQKLRRIVQSFDQAPAKNPEKLTIQRLEFLARLPLLFNNTLDVRKVVQVKFEHAVKMVNAEGATIFLKERHSDELIFWAIMGEMSSKLEGKRMPATKGIVGWVVKNQKSIIVPDTSKDSRFFSVIDNETSFVTTGMLCVPLTVRGSVRLGALQIINKNDGTRFTEQDLLFTEQLANQMALAIDNIQLHDQLVLRHRQLEAIGKKKSEMLRILAHELKTPLSIIQSAAEIIASGIINDEAALARIHLSLTKGVERISKVSQQLSNVSFLGEKMPLEYQKVRVSDLLKTMASQFSSIARQRSLSMEAIAAKRDDSVLCDQTLIEMVLYNLISNAIRFTPDGGKILLESNVSSGMVTISVSDNGIGIEDSQIAAIFDKFYEVGNAMNHSSGEFEFKSGGLGLGLASVQAILEAHNASIQVQSKPGEGSKFIFHLPLID